MKFLLAVVSLLVVIDAQELVDRCGIPVSITFAKEARDFRKTLGRAVRTNICNNVRIAQNNLIDIITKDLGLAIRRSSDEFTILNKALQSLYKASESSLLEWNYASSIAY